MKIKVGYDYVLIRISENPFLRKTTGSGIILASNSAFSNETGDIEKLDQAIGFGIIESAGPDCKYVNEGYGVFFNKRTLTPIPTQIPLWHTSERTILSYYSKEELEQAFEVYQVEKAAYEKKLQEGMSRLQAETLARKEKARAEREQGILDGTISAPKPTGPLIKIKYN